MIDVYTILKYNVYTLTKEEIKMAMQKLNVRFSDETKDYISDSACTFDMTDSEVARAAMNIGLAELNKINDKAQSDRKMFERPTCKYVRASIICNQ